MPRKPYWKNKTVLITGGSSGIGLAAARLLAAKGANIWLTARRRPLLDVAIDELQSCRVDPGQVFGATSADLVNPSEARHVVFAVTQALGVPHVLINSAGITHPGYIHELTLEKFEELMQVNYFGTVYVTKAILPGMMQRSSGHIVNISSMASFVGLYGYSAYGASKFAVNGFSEVLRAEMKPHHIRVSVVFPPDTDTPQLAYEKQFKPAETRVLSGTARALSAPAVASAMLTQIEKGRYLIYPNLDSRAFHIALTILPKSLVFAIMDKMTDKARKNMAYQGNKGSTSPGEELDH